MLLTTIRTEKLGQQWHKNTPPPRTSTSNRRTAKEKRIELDCEEFEEGLRRSLVGSPQINSSRNLEQKQKLFSTPSKYYGLERPHRFDIRPTAGGAKFDFASSSTFGASPSKTATLTYIKPFNTPKHASGSVQDSLHLLDCRKKVKKMLDWNVNKPATTIEDLRRTLCKGDKREEKNAKIDSAFLKKLVRAK